MKPIREITIAEADEIRAACASGEDRGSVAERYGITRGRVGSIARGDSLTKARPEAKALEIGAIYGRWEIKAEGPRNGGVRTYVCACTCGRSRRTIKSSDLVNALTRKCMLCTREKCRARMGLRFRIGVGVAS